MTQTSQTTLASKLKKDKEKEKKPILPFHQRPLPTKFGQLRPVSKGLSTCNSATRVADQNRQPNSHHENEATAKTAPPPKVTKSGDEQPRPKTKSSSWTSVPFNENNNVIMNNNNNECLKGVFPGLTKLADAKMTCDEDFYRDYKVRTPSAQDIWKCYDSFSGDPKLKPRLPEDVLDLREDRVTPLTTESVVTMPEDSGEVFTIETIENEK